MTTDTRLVTIQQACTLFSVCRRTIYNWIATGKVEIVRVPSGAPRVVVAASLLQANGGIR